MSAFITAVKRGNLQEIEQYLTYEDTHELVNQQDTRTHESPLYCACVKGDLVIASCLLAHKARVDLKTKWLATPLHAAAHAGHENIVRLLLRNRCEPNEQTHFGDTALHLASSGNHLGVAKALVEAGTDITLLNSRARNAIQEAQIEGSDLVLDYFTKLFFEGNNEKNSPSEISHTTITQTSRLPKNTEHTKRQERQTDCRGKPEPFADHTKTRKSSRWLHEISNGEYAFLGSSEEENDLSVDGMGSSEDQSAKLNIEPTSPSAQNRLKYLEETIGTLLTDYQKTKSELKSIQNELDETRNLLKSCRHNSCHHCGSRYHAKAEADDTAKPLQSYHETDRETNAQWDYRRKVRFDTQP